MLHISVLFSTKCHSLHNFIIFCSSNTHFFLNHEQKFKYQPSWTTVNWKPTKNPIRFHYCIKQQHPAPVPKVQPLITGTLLVFLRIYVVIVAAKIGWGYQVTNSMVRPVFEVVRYVTKYIRHAFYTQNFHLIISFQENIMK